MFSSARFRRRIAVLSLLLLAVTSIAGCYADRFNRVALRPSSHFRMIPEDLGLDYEIVAVPVRGAVIHAWFIPARHARSAVIVCGGNTGNKEVLLPLALHLHAAGFHVVLPDYRGFGLSTGEPDLWSLVPDTAAIVEAIHARPDTDRLGLIGISLGSVAALGAADRHPELVDAVAVEGVFSPRRAMRESIGGFLATVAGPFILPSGWGVHDHATNLEQPLLFLHGTRDGVTKLGPATEILRAANDSESPRSVWIAADAGHAPGLAGRYGEEYVEHWVRFFAGHLRDRPTVPSVRADWSPVELDGAAAAKVTITLDAHAASPPSPVPIEVCLVGANATTQVHRVWHAGHGAATYRLPAPPDVRYAAASVPGCRVRREGDTWVRDSAYQRDRERLEQIEDRLYRDLGYRPPIRVPGSLILLRDPGDLPDDEARLAACRRADEALAASVARGIHPRARPGYGEMAFALARHYVTLGERDRAIQAYRHFLTLQPADPFSHWWFGDAWWRLGTSPEKFARVHDGLARLISDETLRAIHRTRARAWRQKAADRATRLAAWRVRQEKPLSP